jgi:uncharacterized protein (DUF433 family)
MATQGIRGVVPGSDSDLHDEPHIEGSRVTVRYVQRQVEHRGAPPETVADEHGLDLVDVYAALTYYHSNPDEMRLVDHDRDRANEVAEHRTSLTPPDEA